MMIFKIKKTIFILDLFFKLEKKIALIYFINCKNKKYAYFFKNHRNIID